MSKHSIFRPKVKLRIIFCVSVLGGGLCLDRKYRLHVYYSHVFLQKQVEAQWAQRCPRPLVTQKTERFSSMLLLI